MARPWNAPKDPDEILDFVADWMPRLDGDIIATSLWTLPAGITGGARTQSQAWRFQ